MVPASIARKIIRYRRLCRFQRTCQRGGGKKSWQGQSHAERSEESGRSAIRPRFFAALSNDDISAAAAQTVIRDAAKNLASVATRPRFFAAPSSDNLFGAKS